MREPQLRSRTPAIPRSPRTDARAPRPRKRSFLGGLFRLLLPRRASDAVALLVAFTATVVVFVNALALQRPSQSGPAAAAAPAEVVTKANVPMPPKRTVPAAPAPAPAPMISPSPAPTINSLVPPANIPSPRTDSPAVKARVELITNVQRELSQRGYYDGAFDGLLGPRTEQAIREFEQAHGLRVSGEASETLLSAVKKARHRSEITGSIPAAEEPKQSTRILGVQKTLARLGYGPVKFTGQHDTATRAAIERFERDRGMPVSGEITPKLQGELVSMLGASLD